MTDPDTENSGVLVIRVWIEPDGFAGALTGFRARITSTVDLEHGAQTVAVAASPEAMVEEVRAWLLRLGVTSS